MQICLMIEGQEDVGWEQWMSLALACEEHGFDGLFRSDHYLSFGHPTEYGSLDAWATLAALGRVTGRIRLGTLVSPATFRHPSVLAKSATTVDHASGGRVELGMGAGWFEGEHRAYGFPFPPPKERMSILEEQVEIVHRLWDRDEDAVTFTGRHYQLEDCHALPRPVQEPHPPLLIGGDAGPRSSRLAARWADEYNTTGANPEECRARRERVSAACEAIGRDPGEIRFSLMNTVIAGTDEKELHGRVRRLLQSRGDDTEPKDWIEKVRDERIIGTTDQVLERLAEYSQAGVDRVMMQHLLHTDLDAVALIGREIIPEAADL
jgi:F420-dependent oxidoreductase-like protein